MSADVPRTIGGRYVLHEELASGGMATVHVGRLIGAAGFSRTVAVKRLHPQFAKEADFVSMFVDEARIAARIRHPNVVATLDTVSADGELFLIMELVLGETLSRLVRAPAPVPVEVAVAIVSGALHGLHAAHEATDQRGQWLEIVHRDVSPQNVIVGVDGLARVLDFGVAKALGRLQTTRDGQLKGKVAYMAPEQLRGGQVDRRTDVYAASVVLWEVLAGRRLFVSGSPGETMARVLEQPVVAPSTYAPAVPPAVDEIIMRGLRRDPAQRFGTAEEMAIALEAALVLPTQSTIGRWVTEAGGDQIARRADLIARIDSDSHPVPPMASAEPATTTPSEVLTSVAGPARRVAVPRRWIVAAAAACVALVGGVSVHSCLQASDSIAARQEPPPSDAHPAVAAPPVAPVAVAPPPTTPSTGVGSGIAPDPPPPKKRAASPSRRKPSCSPPYTIDAYGVHVPKKECR